MVYWITGRKNSGKTTLAYRLKKQIPNSVVIDGERVRNYWVNSRFDEYGRRRNMYTMLKIARLLEEQGVTPIIACVSPILLERKECQEWFDECIEICMPFGELWEGTTYEEPEHENTKDSV